MNKALQQHASLSCKMIKYSLKNGAACICQKTQTPELLSLRENNKANIFTETEKNTPLHSWKQTSEQ